MAKEVLEKVVRGYHYVLKTSWNVNKDIREFRVRRLPPDSVGMTTDPKIGQRRRNPNVQDDDDQVYLDSDSKSSTLSVIMTILKFCLLIFYVSFTVYQLYVTLQKCQTTLQHYSPQIMAYILKTTNQSLYLSPVTPFIEMIVPEQASLIALQQQQQQSPRHQTSEENNPVWDGIFSHLGLFDLTQNNFLSTIQTSVQGLIFGTTAEEQPNSLLSPTVSDSPSSPQIMSHTFPGRIYPNDPEETTTTTHFLSSIIAASVNILASLPSSLCSQPFMTFLLLFIPYLYRCHRSQEIVEESVLVVQDLGVQLRSRRRNGKTSTRFLDSASIRSVVINEGFRGWGVIFYLAFIVDGSPDSMVLAFQKFQPRLDILLHTYSGIRAVLGHGTSTKSLSNKKN
eukprot:g1714.t1